LERRLYVLHTSSGRLEKPPLRSPHFQRAAWKAASTFSTLPAGGLKTRLYVLPPFPQAAWKAASTSISCPQAAWKAASTFSTLPAGGLKSRLYVLHTSSGRLGTPPLRSPHFQRAA